MSSLRAISVRNTLVALLLALSAVVSAQFVASVINGVQHGLGVAHDGLVVTSSQDHAHEAVDEPADVGASEGAGSHGTGSTHHHHPDGPQIAPLMSTRAEFLPAARAARIQLVFNCERPSSIVYSVERPPRDLAALHA